MPGGRVSKSSRNAARRWRGWWMSFTGRLRTSSRRRATSSTAPDNGGDMAKNIPLTLACGDYEITRPLKEGIVRPDGIDLTVLTAMDSTTRHWRFLPNRQFLPAQGSADALLRAAGHS